MGSIRRISELGLKGPENGAARARAVTWSETGEGSGGNRKRGERTEEPAWRRGPHHPGPLLPASPPDRREKREHGNACGQSPLSPGRWEGRLGERGRGSEGPAA